MYILGISGLYHDSAACLLADGIVIAAAEEEAFTRIKHDPSFPTNAIRYCLASAGIGPAELDVTAFYEKPIVKFDRILQTAVGAAPRGMRRYLASMPLWIGSRLWIPAQIARELPGFRGRLVFPTHHESHAASAFYPSPFAQAAVLTLDAAGEWNTTTWGVGRGNRIELRRAINFPHSLGMLYSAFTGYLGFRVNSGEYKLMGLAPYGAARYRELIERELVRVRPDGSFRLNLHYFDYVAGFRMTNRHFERLFGGPPRQPEAPLEERHMDIAASIQQVLEDIVIKIARHALGQTNQRALAMAGGVALNCVANGRLLREGVVERLWVQPAATDAGGALGAALWAWHQVLGGERRANPDSDAMQGAYLGPEFSDADIQTALEREGAAFSILDRDRMLECVVDLLAAGKVVGWFHGRMEFGPRALGNRSILGDPRDPSMQSRLNLKIKFRESFRPFAPAVLEERAANYFEGAVRSPYMLLTFPVAGALRRPTNDPHARGLELLKQPRSSIPAVTHVDYSARIQTVARRDNPLFYDLIDRFGKRTGCPMLVNTSFNVRGEPIVCTPANAWRCFMRTDMDALAIGPCLLLKEEQSKPIVPSALPPAGMD